MGGCKGKIQKQQLCAFLAQECTYQVQKQIRRFDLFFSKDLGPLKWSGLSRGVFIVACIQLLNPFHSAHTSANQSYTKIQEQGEIECCFAEKSPLSNTNITLFRREGNQQLHLSATIYRNDELSAVISNSQQDYLPCS
jgi:hypothetical protein